MKTRRLFASAFLATACLINVPASAQDAGFYAGIAFGRSDFKDACAGVPIACDDADTAWKLFGGYQFNKYLGAEFGYVDLGKASANGTILGAAASATAKAKGWELLGVGTLPFSDKFSAYGKAGLFRWDADVSATAVIPGFAPAAVSASDNGTDVTFGLGLKYDHTKNIGVRLEWQRYKDVGNDATTGKSDVDLLSVGIVFKF